MGGGEKGTGHGRVGEPSEAARSPMFVLVLPKGSSGQPCGKPISCACLGGCYTLRCVARRRKEADVFG